MRTPLIALTLVLSGCHSAPAPIDNAAATGCVPGTPESESSSLCNDFTLPNGAEVVAPDNFTETEDRISSENMTANAL